MWNWYKNSHIDQWNRTESQQIFLFLVSHENSVRGRGTRGKTPDCGVEQIKVQVFAGPASWLRLGMFPSRNLSFLVYTMGIRISQRESLPQVSCVMSLVWIIDPVGNLIKTLLNLAFNCMRFLEPLKPRFSISAPDPSA